MKLEWFDTLPDSCPPNDAEIPDGMRVYRCVDSLPLNNDSLRSQRTLAPIKVFNIDECIVRSISVSNNLEAFKNGIKKLPTLKNKKIVEITLNSKDGVVKQTFKPNHYSWWRTCEFDLSNYREV